MPNVYTPLSAIVPEELWPGGLFDSDNASFLDKLACLLYDDRGSDEAFGIYVQVKVMEEARLRLPFLDGFSIVLGEGDSPDTGLIDVEITAELFSDSPPSLEVVISTTVLSLSIDRRLLEPVELVEEGGKLTVKPIDGNIAIPLPFALRLRYVDEDWSLDFDVPAGEKTALDIPTCRIGGTNVVFEASDISLNFSGSGARPAGAPADWKGFYLGQAKLYLPDLFNGSIAATGLGIGSGGFYGDVQATFPLTYNKEPTPHFTGKLATTLFGIPGGISAVSLGFTQNVPTTAEITGKLLLPFFDDAVDVVIGIDAGRGFTVGLSSDTALRKLTKPNILELQLDSIAFELHDGLFVAKISGKITPLVPGIKWPGVDVRELSIDSHGNVHLAGGWLTLPKQYTLPFHGFPLEITQIGFGRLDDGGKWIGFSGKVKLPGELPAGGSVEGLRVIWYPGGRTRITFNGVTVDFSIKNKLTFHGHVAYRELPGDIHRFEGDVKVDLVALKLKLDARLVVGTRAGEPFFALYFEVDVPAGYPIFSTGASLYGMAGLLALQMAPDKKPEESWYENPDGGKGWYKRDPIGVGDVVGKWAMQDGAKAFGAGVTIGTADNGFTFSAKTFLVLVFPGPIILIEGRGNLLQDRAKLADDPLFRALAVLDNDAGTLLIGLDARYRYRAGGELIDVRGGVEGFFDFRDAGNWHLNLGVDTPRARRIHGTLFSLYDAQAYLMISPKELATGAWIGFERHYNFKALKVDIEAWLEGNARLSRKPAHFHGDLWLHGSVRLRIFRVKMGLTVDARLAADVIDPFHVIAEFAVSIDLPWPLGDYEADVTLEWGPRPGKPAIPAVLQEVAIEHFKASTSWPLAATAENLAPPPDDAPAVPLDCRPRITFGRTVHDAAGIGVNTQPPWPDAKPAGSERIGDPTRNEGPAIVRYVLQQVALQQWTAGAWKDVARGPAAPGARQLWGSWAPVPELPSGDPAAGTTPSVANTKLWLWSRTPFDYTRRSGSEWDDWFLTTHPDYPCIPAAHGSEACCDFSRRIAGEDLREISCGEERITFDRLGIVTALEEPVLGFSRALCMHQGLTVQLPGHDVRLFLVLPAISVRLVLAGEAAAEQHVHDFQRVQPQPNNPLVERGTTFEVFDERKERPAEVRFVPVTTSSYGLACEARTDIALACTAAKVELTMFFLYPAAPVSAAGLLPTASITIPTASATLVAYRANGSVVDQYDVADFASDLTVTLKGEGIVSLSIITSGLQSVLLALRFDCGSGGVTATAFSSAGIVATGTPVDHVIVLSGNDIRAVLVESDAPICFVEICVTLPPSPQEVGRRKELAQRMKDALVHWSSAGEVLEPASSYRLVITTASEATFFDPSSSETKPYTDYAYFRTDGPPGLANLSVPVHAAAPDELTLFDDKKQWVTVSGSPSSRRVLASDLSTLAPYVRQTIPPTVAVPPAKEVLARPVYRAYDLGVDFNEDYVDLMYGMAGRDLGLYLFDANDRPLRDADGAPVMAKASWRRAETLILTESERRWVETVNRSRCSVGLTIDTAIILHHRTLTQPSAGIVLDADTPYEARLIPLLPEDDASSLAKAIPAYRFRFLTSRFTSFLHHLHSFEDETWTVDLASSPATDALLARAVALSAPATEDEARAYASLAAALFGAAAERKTEQVEIERLVATDGSTRFLHVRTAEPIDWTRAEVELRSAAADAPAPIIPHAVKLIGAALGTATPDDESVTLLLRETADLGGWRLVWRPGTTSAPFDPAAAAGLPTWYELAAGERFTVGTRLRIHGGDASAAPPAEAGVVTRFAGAGAVRFGGEAVDLILVAPDGAASHARRFVPDAAYTAVAGARILRRRDGTGFFVLPAGTGSLAGGSYRLRLVFRRDNRAADPESVVLSENGDRTPEAAALDFTIPPGRRRRPR